MKTEIMLMNRYLTVLALVLLTGCSQSQDQHSSQSGETGSAPSATDDGALPNAAENTPPIHVEQTAVEMHHGKPAIEERYRRAEAGCRKIKAETPSIEFKPLQGDDVTKLGRTYFLVWYQDVRLSVTADTWGYKTDKLQLCSFAPTHRVEKWVYKPDEINGQHQIGQPDAEATFIFTGGPVARVTSAPPTPQHDVQKAAVMKRLRDAGYGGLIPKDQEMRTIVGQPCAFVSAPILATCTWTGGKDWGFKDDSSVVAASGTAIGGTPFYDTIHLMEKPSDDGDGLYLTTQSMTIGEPVEQTVFLTPLEMNR